MTTPTAAPEVLHHRWEIPERDYARHEARRGQRHAFGVLDPARTALVVVDLVPFFVVENPYCRGIVPVVAALADVVRRAGGTVAWVVPGDDPPPPARVEFLGAGVAAAYAGSGGTGTPRERLWHELVPGPDDLVTQKTAASAFFPGACDLHDHLRERGVDTVVVTGTVTSVCCEATIRDASQLGYRVVAVADAMAGVDDAAHSASLRTIYRSFGDVREAAEVSALLSRP